MRFDTVFSVPPILSGWETTTRFFIVESVRNVSGQEDKRWPAGMYEWNEDMTRHCAQASVIRAKMKGGSKGVTYVGC